jgi:hypothetical protein
MNPVFELIASLARQIGGEIEQQSADTGTATTLKFPLMKYYRLDGDNGIRGSSSGCGSGSGSGNDVLAQTRINRDGQLHRKHRVSRDARPGRTSFESREPMHAALLY